MASPTPSSSPPQPAPAMAYRQPQPMGPSPPAAAAATHHHPIIGRQSPFADGGGGGDDCPDGSKKIKLHIHLVNFVRFVLVGLSAAAVGLVVSAGHVYGPAVGLLIFLCIALAWNVVLLLAFLAKLWLGSSFGFEGLTATFKGLPAGFSCHCGPFRSSCGDDGDDDSDGDGDDDGSDGGREPDPNDPEQGLLSGGRSGGYRRVPTGDYHRHDGGASRARTHRQASRGKPLGPWVVDIILAFFLGIFCPTYVAYLDPLWRFRSVNASFVLSYVVFGSCILVAALQAFKWFKGVTIVICVKGWDEEEDRNKYQIRLPQDPRMSTVPKNVSIRASA